MSLRSVTMNSFWEMGLVALLFTIFKILYHFFKKFGIIFNNTK